jgi:hypothetical protein
VTITGTAVKRSKKVVSWSKRGTNLGVCVFPSTRAIIANTEHIVTNAIVSRVDTAELNFNDSVQINKSNQISNHSKKKNVL